MRLKNFRHGFFDFNGKSKGRTDKKDDGIRLHKLN